MSPGRLKRGRQSKFSRSCSLPAVHSEISLKGDTVSDARRRALQSIDNSCRKVVCNAEGQSLLNTVASSPPSALDSFFFQCGYCFRQSSKPIMLKILKIIPCSHAMVPIVSKLNLYILNPSIVPVKAIISDMQLLCNRPSTQITFRNFLSGIHCKRIC